jgi:predicted esterase
MEAEGYEYDYSHGIAADEKQALEYVPWIIPKKPSAVKYPHATNRFWRTNPFEVSFAQEPEVDVLAKHFFEKVGTIKPTILVGLSNGACTDLNFMCEYQLANVEGMILESPFANPMDIVENILEHSHLDYIPGSHTAGALLLASIFRNYNRNGITPLQQVLASPLHIPMLLIASEEDQLVPLWSTLRLFNAIRENNENAHLLVLPEGKHGKLITNERMRALYTAGVHQFYQEYGLPCDAQSATAGKILFGESHAETSTLAHFKN